MFNGFAIYAHNFANSAYSFLISHSLFQDNLYVVESNHFSGMLKHVHIWLNNDFHRAQSISHHTDDWPVHAAWGVPPQLGMHQRVEKTFAFITFFVWYKQVMERIK